MSSDRPADRLGAATSIDFEREERLIELRREAERTGAVASTGVRPPGAPFPRAESPDTYYGIPLLKAPSWKWEIPLYFFVGGAAGASAVIAEAAAIAGGRNRRLVRDARWIATVGGAIAPVLLISDLGRPKRFLNMLRVFKRQSPMSVGAWTLVAFSSSAGPTKIAELIRRRRKHLAILGCVEHTCGAVAGATGAVMTTYTGVLLGTTAVPAWAAHAERLPVHFAASSLAAAVSLLDLCGHGGRGPVRTLALTSSLAETALGQRLARPERPGTEALAHGSSGRRMCLARFLSGPLPSALRLASFAAKRPRPLRKAAAAAAIAGSLLCRDAWVRAGRASTRNPRAGLNPRPPRPERPVRAASRP